MSMTPRRRLVFAIVLSALALAAMLVTIGIRLQHWSTIGWAGMNYFPEVPARARASMASSFMKPGHIIVAYPGSPATRAGIKGEDEIRTINGIPIGDLKRLEQLNRQARTGDVLTYHVARGNTQRDVKIRFESPLLCWRMLLSMGVSVALAMSFAIIGLVVFLRRPDDRRSFVFYVMSIVGALSFLGSITVILDASNLRGIVTTPTGSLAVIATYMAITFAFGALTLHLSLIFPHDRPIVHRRPYVIRWIYVLPIFAAVIFWLALASPALVSNSTGEATFTFALGKGFRFIIAGLAVAGALVALRIARKAAREGLKSAFLSRPIQTMFAFDAIVASGALLFELAGGKAASRIIFFVGVCIPFVALLAYPLFTFIALYRSYREANVEEKRQVKWPLWGTMIAIAIKILFGLSGIVVEAFVSMRMLDATSWMNVVQTLELIPRIFYLLIPVSFAIAILKYRLMNIDVIIKKTVAYGILSGLIIAIYFLLVGGLGTMLVTVAGVKNQTMVIASTLVVALVFVPLRNRLQHLVDRNLFRQKYDYPQALRAISAETLAATDLRAFLAFAAEALQQAVQNRSVVIFDRRQDDLVASAKVGLPDSILGAVRLNADQAQSIDRPLNPGRRQLPEDTANGLRRVDTALAVPIRSHDFLHGVIAFGPKLSDREFDLEDLEFISSAADQIAITIDRIRLQRDEEDFEQARAMQHALLPASVPKIAGLDVSGTWKPARDVSGDYYDLLGLSPTQLAVCIGDVAGKGMPAALLMSALQAAVRASATPELSPAALCERVRRVIVPSLAGGRFVTFFFCMIDTAAKRIRYCNAGHNPPVLVRADGTTIRLSEGGPAISRLLSSTSFSDGEHELREGDRIVLFTDGVSESRDAAGNDYSEERIEQMIATNRAMPARELITTIVDSVSAFSSGRVDDDLTMVAIAVA